MNTPNDRIQIDPAICHGKPVIRGTRVMVKTILGCLAGGDSVEAVAKAFEITEADIAAAIAFSRCDDRAA